MPEAAAGLTALILAGRRPGADPLAAQFGVADKALVGIDGEAMLSRVARTLAGHPRIGRVLILSQDGRALAAHPQTRWMLQTAGIGFEAGGNSIAGAIAATAERNPDDFPFLVTTADNPLLDHAMIDAFLAEAEATDAAFALVERRTLLARYPQSRRTWLRFRGGAYSGANLFWFGSAKILPALDIWRSVEQQRKKGRAVIGVFGPWILIGAGLRILSLGQAVRLAARKLGIAARAVVLPFAEACIDVDKPEDHALVTSIIERRR